MEQETKRDQKAPDIVKAAPKHQGSSRRHHTEPTPHLGGEEEARHGHVEALVPPEAVAGEKVVEENLRRGLKQQRR